MRAKLGFGLLAVVCVFVGAAAAQQTVDGFVIPGNLPLLKLPIVVTTCGQGPGALMFDVICDTAGIPCEERELLTVEEFVSECTGDTAWNVLVIITGTSLKGMGAAGVDVDSEVKRCLALIEAARELGVTIIVAQIEGPSRRTDEYDEKSIRAMTPEADLLITRSDVNDDGYFTRIAEEKGIPQIFIEKTLDLQKLLPILFGMN